MQGFLKEGQWYPTYILYIIYIYIYICLASCTKPLISDVDFLCEGWCVAWTPTSLLPSTKKTATEQWPNPCLLNVFFHFGVIVIPQTDACILYIYIIHMISLNRCPLSFHLPFVVFEGTLIKSYKSIMIWIWNVIICFPILYWAFPLLRPLRVESEVRCRGIYFFWGLKGVNLQEFVWPQNGHVFFFRFQLESIIFADLFDWGATCELGNPP